MNNSPSFKPDGPTFLAAIGLAHRFVQRQAGESFFTQGEPAGSIFYLHFGWVKLTVLSPNGKEGTLMLLCPGDFAGEEAAAEKQTLRIATATPITHCILVEIPRSAILRGLRESRACSDLFLAFLLRRNMRIQAELIDHLFNLSEKRLARTLLLLAELTDKEEPAPLLPSVTQETLAEMIGTTRSRVNFFMNRFRDLGFIEYKGRIRVNKVRLALVLEDANPARVAG